MLHVPQVMSRYEPATKSVSLLGISVMFVLVGCGTNFENPINWDESIRSSELLGVWKSVEGAEDPQTVSVSSGVDGLNIEMIYLNKRTEEEERATFTGHLRASNELHVLQVNLDTYQEWTSDGETKNIKEEGYVFFRVELDGNNLLVRDLSFDDFGKAAEEFLQDREIQMDVREVSDCLETEVQIDVAIKSLPELMNERDWDHIAATLKLEVEDWEEFKAGIDGKLDKVDPFRQINSLRTCVAKKLPSEMLGRVMESNADSVFVGETIELVRM